MKRARSYHFTIAGAASLVLHGAAAAVFMLALPDSLLLESPQSISATLVYEKGEDVGGTPFDIDSETQESNELAAESGQSNEVKEFDSIEEVENNELGSAQSENLEVETEFNSDSTRIESQPINNLAPVIEVEMTFAGSFQVGEESSAENASESELIDQTESVSAVVEVDDLISSDATEADEVLADWAYVDSVSTVPNRADFPQSIDSLLIAESERQIIIENSPLPGPKEESVQSTKVASVGPASVPDTTESPVASELTTLMPIALSEALIDIAEYRSPVQREEPAQHADVAIVASIPVRQPTQTETLQIDNFEIRMAFAEDLEVDSDSAFTPEPLTSEEADQHELGEFNREPTEAGILLIDEFEVRIALSEVVELESKIAPESVVEFTSAVDAKLAAEEPKSDEFLLNDSADAETIVLQWALVEPEQIAHERDFEYVKTDLTHPSLTEQISKVAEFPVPKQMKVVYDAAIAELSEELAAKPSTETTTDWADEIEVRRVLDESSEFESGADAIEPIKDSNSKRTQLVLANDVQPEIDSGQPSTRQPIMEFEQTKQISGVETVAKPPLNLQPTASVNQFVDRSSESVDSLHEGSMERFGGSGRTLQTSNLALASLQHRTGESGTPVSDSSAPLFGAPGLSNPAPKYPYLARANNEEGRVILRVQVDRKGKTIRVDTHESSGYRRLDRAAKRAVQNWGFEPARVAGIPTEGVAFVPVNFVLKN